jgi:hypothetical protein
VANYPGAFDSAASLFTPVDAFSGKPLETTTIAQVPLMASTTPKRTLVRQSFRIPARCLSNIAARF